jgi:Arc/MetJ-type ribon-helix-helix transcriptional regulator
MEDYPIQMNISLKKSDSDLIEEMMNQDKIRNRSDFIRKLIHQESLRRNKIKKESK